MAVDYGYIMSFDNSSGLPPQVVAALNNNFYHLANMFEDPQIVMASGSELPEPRTTESLFYDDDSGNLYIWKLFKGDPYANPPTQDEWGWGALDSGIIHVDDNDPDGSSYRRNQEIIWYDESHHTFYLWYRPPNMAGDPNWWSLEDIIRNVVGGI